MEECPGNLLPPGGDAPPLFSPLVEAALRVAASAHRSQSRKGTGVPYFTHVAGVALLLARAGFCDNRVLCAAILHDVVEDTDVTLEQLAGQFPTAVIELVAVLSEHKLDEAGQPRSWEARKADHLAAIGAAPPAARAIALADKLHNLETMLLDLASGTLDFGLFRAAPPRLVWYYESMIEAASGRDAPLIPLAEACRAALDRLRAVIGETHGA